MNSLDIGSKILKFRRQKGLTIKDLAEKTRLTSSMLSQIERGNANPSINSLRVIADALDLPLVSFFDHQGTGEEMVVRADQRRRVTLPDYEGVVVESLSPNFRGAIGFLLLKLQPGRVTSEDLTSHDGEESALVLGGKARVHVDDGVFELNDGDSIRIPPGKPHRWENSGDTEISIIYATCPPSI